jgi:hypothetical protein
VDDRAELEWSDKAWKRFEREIYPFIDGRPNPEELLKVPLDPLPFWRARLLIVVRVVCCACRVSCSVDTSRSRRKSESGTLREVSSEWSS